MKTLNVDLQKKIYCTPIIEHIRLDNEISLALESGPPVFPDENISKAPEFFNSDPFKQA